MYKEKRDLLILDILFFSKCLPLTSARSQTGALRQISMVSLHGNKYHFFTVCFNVSADIYPCSFCAPRLDLVPINRSVGLKAKPTKPVTEVLRPVVAKYGLHLSDLVAKIVSRPRWLQCLHVCLKLLCVCVQHLVQCVTVPQGGVSWSGEGSDRILFHLYTVVSAVTQPGPRRWSSRAIITNDDTPQTCQLFLVLSSTPARGCILVLWVSRHYNSIIQ